MTKTNSKLTLKQLKKRREKAADAYYNSDHPIMTDMDYDILCEQIIELDPEYQIPVGYSAPKSQRVPLPIWLGSQTKYKTDPEIQKWKQKYPNNTYVVTDKLDGVSALLFGEKLYTRGNGKVGTDISHLLEHLHIPNTNLCVRGELILPIKKFKKYAKEFSNARNLVSGVINRKSYHKALKDIVFVPYQLINFDDFTPEQELAHLTSHNFQTVHHTTLDTTHITQLELAKLLTKRKHDSPFEIDGLVITQNKPYTLNTKDNPKNAFAFKTQGTITQTTVTGVTWDISRHGVFKPVALLKPVTISSNTGTVTIKKATAFNARYVVDNKLGKGSLVSITRSGDVIPFIVSVDKPCKKVILPSNCTWNSTKIDLVHNNKESNTQYNVKNLTNFFTKLEVKHVSNATITKLYNAGYKTIKAILEMSREDLEQIDTFKARLAERTYTNIHNALVDVELSVLMAAWGGFGFGVGRRKLRDLCAQVDVLDEDLSIADIVDVKGFSDKSAEKIMAALPKFKKFFKDTKKLISIKTSCGKKEEVSDSVYQGKTIVFSGFRDKELEKQIVGKGGKVSTSLSKNTFLLVVKDIKATTGKIKKARNLGVNIIEKGLFNVNL